ncbi:MULTISPECIES: DUF6287 domain-containing protein [Furfurilactobacillus]|uniref:DUF6287 domain-containing protein n=1 Tax=Furfurilactobacillus rossiae TaxID=231049 RepID=A0A7C9N991_9LACO|nr:DUF6287 domain-containing protein [Furfurilactobacillus milii]MYV05010.1 hypothetical protein [Furfurilactobacillus milii]
MNTYKKKTVAIVIGLVLTSGGVLAGCQSKQSDTAETSSRRTSSFSASKISSVSSSKSDANEFSSNSDSSSNSTSDSSDSASSLISSSTEASSVNSSVKKSRSVDSEQNFSPETMSFNQIQNGDFSSLTGTWVETATASNHHPDAPGVQWTQDPSELTSTLTVDNQKISDGFVTLEGNKLFQKNEEPLHMKYSLRDGFVTADLSDDNAINWSIDFYPQGVTGPTNMNNGVTDDTSKNRIVFWTSNNCYTEYFVQQ